MPVKTLAAREFTRDVAAAKQAALTGPVFVTERGKPAFALLSIAEYHRLTDARQESLLEAMHRLPASDAEVSFDKAQIQLQVPELE